MQETNLQINDKPYWVLVDLFRNISGLCILGWMVSVGAPIFYLLVVLTFLAFPFLCKGYGLIIASFTILSGIKLAFSGQFFVIAPVIPVTVMNLEVSYCCLGWGVLAAGRRTHSKLGLLLGIAYVLGGVLGLLQFRQSTYINAPGVWGSAVSAILIICLGYFMIKVIVASWRKSKAT
ncbi:hypothetical protein HRE53_09155 [Acaryochloris sp. 'Moss Beach']|uniref:hypothetical protein n=1 Tax=Acaryochloris sp. 'Moss Beach' TaxID=2740837 RepID=UPI001F48B8F6|nr:hypothetical protein [Acaryochloris sp. 'Moss Beach']UJB71141.1 hypothetical protein HRE53_09155 [Acaryochloris sp. 'Moss Beach']